MEFEQTLALIKPDVFSKANEIKKIINNAGFIIVKEKNYAENFISHI
jgi:nucleoside diphosphate kinase